MKQKEIRLSLKKFLINRRLWIILLGFIFCVHTILTSGFLSVTPNDDFSTQRARILSVDNSNLMPDPEYQDMILGAQILEIEILTGRFQGQIFENIENRLQPLFSNMAAEGMVMLFNIRSQDDDIIKIDMFGYSRDSLVYGLVGLFILILIVVGRKKGVYSVIALAFTIITVIYFMIPSILKGSSPILMAILASVFTSIFSIFIISDISLKSLASVAGIIIGVTSAGIIGSIAGHVGHVSGMNMSDSEGVLALAQHLPLKIPELLTASIIIAALGAVMDVSMSISSAIFEVKKINPNLTVRKLYQSGMNIGRDIIGTMSNTLILAFAGSSLSVLIIISLYQLPYMCLINLNLFIVELVQAIASSIGLILTVPITAIFAATLASGHKLCLLPKNRRFK